MHSAVLYILLISIIVVIVHLFCCSVKLPLSRPMIFCLFFLSILLPTPAGGQAIEQPHGPLLLARAKPRHCSFMNRMCSLPIGVRKAHIIIKA